MRASEIAPFFEEALKKSDFLKSIPRWYDTEKDYLEVETQKEDTDLGSKGIVIQGFLTGTELTMRSNQLPGVTEQFSIFYYSVIVNPMAKRFFESRNPILPGDPEDWRGKDTLVIAEELMIFLSKEVCDCNNDISLHKTPLVRVANDPTGDGYLQWDVVFEVKNRY